MSVPWSGKGSKGTIVPADEVLIIDSEDGVDSTKNKRAAYSVLEAAPWSVDRDANGNQLNDVQQITQTDYGGLDLGTNAIQLDHVNGLIAWDHTSGTNFDYISSPNNSEIHFGLNSALEMLLEETQLDIFDKQIIKVLNVQFNEDPANLGNTLTYIQRNNAGLNLHIQNNDSLFIKEAANILFEFNEDEGFKPNVRVQGLQGSNLAATSTLTFGLGNFFLLTSGTAIDFITTTNWENGTKITVAFTANVTINHATGSPPANTTPIFLEGAVNANFVIGDTLTIIKASSEWLEISRSSTL